MKARNARKIEGALLEIVHKLGIKKCSNVVDKSTSLIRKWSDPDICTLPSLQQALALDLEYARELRGIPPILHVYSLAIQNVLEADEDVSAEEGMHILSSLLALQESVCELGKKISKEIRKTKEINKINKNIKQEMFNDIDSILRKTHNLEIAINLLHSEKE